MSLGDYIDNAKYFLAGNGRTAEGKSHRFIANRITSLDSLLTTIDDSFDRHCVMEKAKGMLNNQTAKAYLTIKQQDEKIAHTVQEYAYALLGVGNYLWDTKKTQKGVKRGRIDRAASALDALAEEYATNVDVKNAVDQLTQTLQDNVYLKSKVKKLGTSLDNYLSPVLSKTRKKTSTEIEPYVIEPEVVEPVNPYSEVSKKPSQFNKFMRRTAATVAAAAAAVAFSLPFLPQKSVQIEDPVVQSTYQQQVIQPKVAVPIVDEYTVPAIKTEHTPVVELNIPLLYDEAVVEVTPPKAPELRPLDVDLKATLPKIPLPTIDIASYLPKPNPTLDALKKHNDDFDGIHLIAYSVDDLEERFRSKNVFERIGSWFKKDDQSIARHNVTVSTPVLRSQFDNQEGIERELAITYAIYERFSPYIPDASDKAGIEDLKKYANGQVQLDQQSLEKINRVRSGLADVLINSAQMKPTTIVDPNTNEKFVVVAGRNPAEMDASRQHILEQVVGGLL